MPVLILHGAADATIPPTEATAMRAARPGAPLVLIPNAGHVPMLEASAVVTAALRAFLGACQKEEVRN
jgi:pimeloyl-ACP methyl ester carboxylesterase